MISNLPIIHIIHIIHVLAIVTLCTRQPLLSAMAGGGRQRTAAFLQLWFARASSLDVQLTTLVDWQQAGDSGRQLLADVRYGVFPIRLRFVIPSCS